VDGADVTRIARTVAGFAPTRQADLWSGLGVACAYAGGADEEAVRRLFGSSGRHQGAFAQGVAFAAKARQAAGNPSAHTEMVCWTTCNLAAHDLATLADETVTGLPPDGAEPAYEVWRRRIQTALVAFGVDT
jgi:hypothetical protein